MVGWHHRLDEHEFEQAPGDSEGQDSLLCCSPWGCKELVGHDSATEQQQNICVCMCVCVCACMLSHVQVFAVPWTIACQAPLFMDFSKQEYWNELSFPTPGDSYISP